MTVVDAAEEARLAPARAALRERGWALLPGAVDGETVATLRAAIGAAPAERPNAYGVIRHNVWEDDPTFAAFVREGPLGPLARLLLEVEEVVLFQDVVVWKPPETAVPLAWHQDYSYWPLSAPAGLTAWLALDDADPENGCLHYIPGTHLEGERQPADFVVGAGQPPRDDLPPLDWERREHQAVATPTRAGDLLVHDPLVWHMSPANHSRRQRRAYSLTWLTPSVRWDPGHAPHPFLWQLHPSAGAPVQGPRFPRISSAARAT